MGPTARQIGRRAPGTGGAARSFSGLRLLLLCLLLLAPAVWGRAQATRDRDEAKHLDKMLTDLYPKHDFAANTLPTTDSRELKSPAGQSLKPSGPATSTTLVLRRAKGKKGAAEKKNAKAAKPSGARKAGVASSAAASGDDATSRTRLVQSQEAATTATTPGATTPGVPAAGLDLKLLVEPEADVRTTETATTLSLVSLDRVKGKSGKAAATPQPTPVPAATAIRVNRADAGELGRKLKLDARRARLVIEFRDLYGPFKGPDDLRQVSGITDEMVRRWEDQGILSFE